jgi:proteasome lid subunit RPN8/RPN11
VLFHAEVLQRIRQHARSSMDAEICGVLVGRIMDGHVIVEAGIEGDHAAQAGSHVTFTQDTWEHIYRIKDQQFLHQKIVGWYHSHPGFGIFLSEYDTFIHENFFSAPHQIAWVYDPHSDEEGCFVWDKGKLKRLKTITVLNPKADEDEQPRAEPESGPIAVDHGAASSWGRSLASLPRRLAGWLFSARRAAANKGTELAGPGPKTPERQASETEDKT